MSGLGLLGLFLAAFIAATPLPMNSEIPFVALQSLGHRPWVLVVVATLGNVLGSCVTYGCGRWARQAQGSAWFPLSEDQLAKAQGWFQRWGLWTLLLSWAPAGDLIVALAGLMRVPFALFLLFVTLAKALRYIVVALVTAGAVSLF